MSDYEVIENDPISEEISQHIADLDSPSLVHSDLEKSLPDNQSFKSDCIYEGVEKAGISQIKFDDSLQVKKEEIAVVKESSSDEGKKGKTQRKFNDELISHIFKEHYFIAVFGLFTLVQTVNTLISYLKEK